MKKTLTVTDRFIYRPLSLYKRRLQVFFRIIYTQVIVEKNMTIYIYVEIMVIIYGYFQNEETTHNILLDDLYNIL